MSSSIRSPGQRIAPNSIAAGSTQPAAQRSSTDSRASGLPEGLQRRNSAPALHAPKPQRVRLANHAVFQTSPVNFDKMEAAAAGVGTSPLTMLAQQPMRPTLHGPAQGLAQPMSAVIGMATPAPTTPQPLPSRPSSTASTVSQFSSPPSPVPAGWSPSPLSWAGGSRPPSTSTISSVSSASTASSVFSQHSTSTAASTPPPSRPASPEKIGATSGPLPGPDLYHGYTPSRPTTARPDSHQQALAAMEQWFQQNPNRDPALQQPRPNVRPPAYNSTPGGIYARPMEVQGIRLQGAVIAGNHAYVDGVSTHRPTQIRLDINHVKAFQAKYGDHTLQGYLQHQKNKMQGLFGAAHAKNVGVQYNGQGGSLKSLPDLSQVHWSDPTVGGLFRAPGGQAAAGKEKPSSRSVHPAAPKMRAPRLQAMRAAQQLTMGRAAEPYPKASTPFKLQPLAHGMAQTLQYGLPMQPLAAYGRA